jgi:hypothetical protein
VIRSVNSQGWTPMVVVIAVLVALGLLQALRSVVRFATARHEVVIDARGCSSIDGVEVDAGTLDRLATGRVVLPVRQAAPFARFRHWSRARLDRQAQ